MYKYMPSLLNMSPTDNLLFIFSVVNDGLYALLLQTQHFQKICENKFAIIVATTQIMCLRLLCIAKNMYMLLLAYAINK